MENETSTLEVIEVIQQTGNGQTLYEFDNALKEATRALRDNGGNATVTLTLKMNGKVGENQVTLIGEVKKTLPKTSVPLKVLYSMPDGRLCVNDPAQAAFKFKATESSVPQSFGERNG